MNARVLVTAVLLVGCGGGTPLVLGEDRGESKDYLDVAPVEDAGEELLMEFLTEGLLEEPEPGPIEDDGAQGDEVLQGFEDLPSDVKDLDGGEPSCDGCNTCPEDGLPCTTTVMTEDGVCVTVILKDFCLIDGKCYFTFQPDPQNQCAFCIPSQSQEAFTYYEGLPCDDNEPCTAPDTCGPDGTCISGGWIDCDDQNVCTIDFCEPGEGCRHKPFDSVCDDHNACTYNDTCKNGKCTGLPLPCKDTNPCTDDVCDPSKGCIFLFNEAPCDDGNACTVEDRCSEGQCKGLEADCDDGDPCTLDSCNPSFGCQHQWHYGACDDGDACTVNDFCNGEHKCVGYPRTCYDGNPCTDDTCDRALGCLFTPNSNPCDDGDPCTEGDRCTGGVCLGRPKDCEDGNYCTIDTCDAFGCHHEFTTGACDDHNACTTSDNCATGQCIGVPVDCDDHNPCTSDYCNPAKGCIHEPIAASCDDGDPCTLGDHCEAGKCVGTPKVCDDGDPCTIDSCNAFGVCVHTPHSGPCDDGDACTGNDICKNGVCKGEPIDCDDHNPCTIDGCDKTWGCVYTPTGPKPCDDGSVCTHDDHCSNGVCVGIPIDCHDGNLCTRDECDPKGGCYFVPFSGPCDDSNICTTDDQCTGGVCSGRSLFNNPVIKAATFSFGVSGNPGQGLDVDGNQGTCAPMGSCVKGIDNAFATLSWLFNPEMSKAVNEGRFAFLVEQRGDGVAIYFGERMKDAACGPAQPGCLFGVYPDMITGQCLPNFLLGNVSIEGNVIRAGGKGFVAPLYLVFGDLRIRLNLEWAQIEVALSLGTSSGQGVLGGAVSKAALVDAIKNAPPSGFPPPYTPDLVAQYVDLYLKPDIDLDSDGTKEAVSIGLPFTVVPGVLVGPLSN